MSGSGGDRRVRPSSAGARWATTRRSLVGASALLLRRRARRDAPLLLGWIALLCLATLLALAVPRLVLDTVDSGAREAVAEASSTADVVVRTQIGDPHISPEFVTIPTLTELALLVPQNLPPGLARVSGPPTTTVLSPVIRVKRVAGDAAATRVQAQFGLLGADQEPALRLVEGRLPAATAGSEIEVVVSRETAEVATLPVGSALDVAVPTQSDDEPRPDVVVRVVGVVASTQPASATSCATAWCDLPTMWAPELRDSRSAGDAADVTLLTNANGIAVAQTLTLDSFDAAVRLPLLPERFTSALVTTVINETTALEANGSPLSAGSAATIDVRTDFPQALREYAARAAASVAQMSLMIAGLFGAVAAVMLLVGGLLVRRRSAEVALERARGASLGSVAVRGLTESALLAAVGVASGVLLAALIVPGQVRDPLLLAVVCAVAVLGPPTQALLTARAAWSGRRVPANRRDRQQIESRARVRRVVLELSIVVLAVAALASVRSRGLVQARTDGTDPLLAATPLLLGIVVTIVVLRLQPLAVRATAALASRGRGAVGLLGAAHAERAVAALPLLALTLAVALVVGGSLVVQTVREGQVDASWQRVGADARVGGVIDRSVADDVRAAPGVTAASAQLTGGSVEIDSGATSASATVVAIDSDFARVAARLPAGAAPDQASLNRLAAASASPDALPVLIDERLAARINVDDVVMVFDDERVTLRVVATFEGGPDGYLTHPFVYADIDALGALLSDAPVADTLLVMGEGAAAAAHSVDASGDVTTRADWLTERRDRALVQGVDRMTWLAIASVALLAAIALVTTVAAGGRSRSRSLSLLRTLGVKRRFGWVLALAELAPLVVAALVGGAVAGAAMLLAVGPAIGLRILAGGVGEPALRVDVSTVVLVIVGSIVLGAIAIVVDVVAHRRDRPGEVLRVGETT